MDGDRRKRTAEWFYSNIFRDEAIRPRPAPQTERLPALLRTARSLGNRSSVNWQTREAVFMKQGKLLAAYEDDYEFDTPVVRYYPTYESLNDRELRGYFSWRTKLRKGIYCKTSLTFVYLYIYELLNGIGVADTQEGYRRLVELRAEYGQLDAAVIPYLDRWIFDFIIYYDLDPNLLADDRRVVFDRCILILEHIQEQNDAKVMYAVKQLAAPWLERSKFYAAYGADLDTVAVRVLRQVSTHYATRCKKSFVEQYFGVLREVQVRLFDTAVFCDPLKKRSGEFVLDELCTYTCRGGLWSVTRRSIPPQPNTKLGDLLKTIDAIMREEYGYRYPIKYETDAKWLLKLIRQEVQALLAEKKAAEAKKLTIDYSKLDKIRSDAAITRDKLTVEEEEWDEPEEPTPVSENPDTPLDKAEYRLLQCLLYGGGLDWVQKEGLMLSVLVDGINEKLYDTFLDTVLDDSPALIDDYIDELKEMVRP